MAYKLPLSTRLSPPLSLNPSRRNNSVPPNEPYLLLPPTSRGLHVLFPLRGTLGSPLTPPCQANYYFVVTWVSLSSKDFPIPQGRVKWPSFVPNAAPLPHTCPATLELLGSPAKPGFESMGCVFSIFHCNLRNQNIVGTQVFLVDWISKQIQVDPPLHA